MKFTVASLGMLAAVASAAAPRHLYFPRGNHTNPAQLGPQAGPQAGPIAVPAAAPAAALASGVASNPRPIQSAGAESTTTTTMTSTLHTTTTRYVRPNATPSAAGANAGPNAAGANAGGEKEGKTTTTLTSRVTTTVVISKTRANQTPAAAAAAAQQPAVGGDGGDGGAGSQCAPSTVTVTASPSAPTVFVTVTPQAVEPQAVGGGQQPPANPKPVATSQSTITVVPFPSGNGTRPHGAARPSGFARMHR